VIPWEYIAVAVVLAVIYFTAKKLRPPEGL
jgi:hypothetical protein